MKNLLIIILLFCNSQIFAQTVLYLHSNDTILCDRFEQGFPKCKYWVDGEKKPKKIEFLDIAAKFDMPIHELDMNQVDDFTGNSYKTTRRNELAISKIFEGGYSHNLFVWFAKAEKDKHSGYFIFVKPTINLGCSGANKNYSLIKLKNGEVVKLEKDLTEIDCGELPYSMYKIDDDIIALLRKHKAKSIRVAQSDSFEDYNFPIPNSIIKSLETLDK